MRRENIITRCLSFLNRFGTAGQSPCFPSFEWPRRRSQMRRVWRENAGKVRNSYLGTEMPSLMINKSGNVVACDFVSSYEHDSSHHWVITRFWERRPFQQATVTLLRREKAMSCEVSYLGTKNENDKCWTGQLLGPLWTTSHQNLVFPAVLVPQILSLQ